MRKENAHLEVTQIFASLLQCIAELLKKTEEMPHGAFWFKDDWILVSKQQESQEMQNYSYKNIFIQVK